MGRIKCVLVKFRQLDGYTAKTFIARDFQNKKFIIPVSLVYNFRGENEVWIPEWKAAKDGMTFSRNHNVRYYDTVTRKILPKVTVTEHIPKKIVSDDAGEIKELMR